MLNTRTVGGHRRRSNAPTPVISVGGTEGRQPGSLFSVQLISRGGTERCYGAGGGGNGNFVAAFSRWSAAMPQPNDLSVKALRNTSPAKRQAASSATVSVP